MVFSVIIGVLTLWWDCVYFSHLTSDLEAARKAQNEENGEEAVRSGLWERVKQKRKLRNLSPEHDPMLRIPFWILMPATTLCFICCLVRAYILVEDFVSLRELPPSAYATVDWTLYLPLL